METATIELSEDLQASIRWHAWSLVQGHGLASAAHTTSGQRGGRLGIDVLQVRDGGLACRYRDDSIGVHPVVAAALISYHSSPARYRAPEGFEFLSPGDAHLAVVHETVHCCGSNYDPNKEWTKRMPSLSDNVDELVTELSARAIVAAELGFRTSDIFLTEARKGSYDTLILGMAETVAAVSDCEVSVAVDRLGAACVALRRDLPRCDAITAIGVILDTIEQDGQ